MKRSALIRLGIPKGEPLQLALAAVPKLSAVGVRGKAQRTLMEELAYNPSQLVDHPQLGGAARALLDALAAASVNVPARAAAKTKMADAPGVAAGALADARAAATEGQVRAPPVPCRIWGEDHEPTALGQLKDACSLPVSVAAALMPDAHQGYGLPIGGVLATRGAVIPYAVGVDIACRMRMSVLDWPVAALTERQEELIEAVERETRFGVGAQFAAGERRQHRVMDEDWGFTPLVSKQRDTAWSQLGTSGGGNHFVELGVLTVEEEPLEGDASVSLGLEPGSYLALLSHSGSRGTGAKIAEHYSNLAARQHPELPRQIQRLAWLDLKSEDGQAYWAAMSLMGRYAAANHELIHRFVLRRLGAEVLASVENHHNFAWIERHRGEDLVVHRKGATPAGPSAIGVIPGSMATPGYVVRGLGEPESMHSASHGAGRRMSRKEATRRFNWTEARDFLKRRNVHLISGGLDEVPMAYKDIDTVMAAQRDLVVPLARFDPRLVKMAPAEKRRYGRR